MKWLLNALALSGLMLFASSSFAGMWLADDTGDLYHIASPGGAIDTIGSSGVSGLTALTMDSAGNLYSTDGANLYTLNKTTGLASLVGSFGGTSGIEGLAFDGIDTLWGANGGGLFIINTGTGFASFVSAMTHSYDDLAVAKSDVAGTSIVAGDLLGLDATTNAIYEIDFGTYVEALVESVPLTVGDEAITTDTDGVIYTHNFDREPGGLGGIYQVDVSGASLDTFVMTTNPRITGMFLDSAGDPVPAPGVLWLLGAAFVGLRLNRRH
ncbi:MAG: hypothetical protein KDI42_01075 [Gammaproteobacteria bacterium]|nr:hypothetical protein [Gammaproteobacteria bacterium]